MRGSGGGGGDLVAATAAADGVGWPCRGGVDGVDG